jgi:hypothetical protein
LAEKAGSIKKIGLMPASPLAGKINKRRSDAA